jgi:hypothetical protein
VNPVSYLSVYPVAQLTGSSLVKRFAHDVVGPKVREMDENEMMDPSVIKSLFEQGVCDSLPFRCILLTFVAAHGHRNERGAWRRRILVHCSNNCHRRARQSRPFGICFVRRSQYACKYGDPQIRYTGATGEVVASAC